jgi:hypothetical protein
MRKWLIHAPNEFVAEIIRQRLAEGGVRSFSVGSARPSSLAGGRDIYVEELDLEHARRILKSVEDNNEEA